MSRGRAHGDRTDLARECSASTRVQFKGHFLPDWFG
jgi:hypothetical protein